jgi:hypothetical protein
MSIVATVCIVGAMEASGSHGSLTCQSESGLLVLVLAVAVIVVVVVVVDVAVDVVVVVVVVVVAVHCHTIRHWHPACPGLVPTVPWQC